MYTGVKNNLKFKVKCGDTEPFPKAKTSGRMGIWKLILSKTVLKIIVTGLGIWITTLLTHDNILITPLLSHRWRQPS